MNVILTLTTVGIDHGALFDLYSNADGYSVAFDTNVALVDLQAGYTTNAPDNTTVVRVVSQSTACPNTLDILLNYTTSTTTTLGPVGCEETINSGGEGVTELIFPLEELGGILLLDFTAYGVPDKLEILHNNVKKATSGIASVPNEGPFDDVYGDPTVPTFEQTLTVDQFLGQAKEPLEDMNDRSAELYAETGLSFTPNGQQLIWWVYTPDDVLVDAYATVRVTGPSGTVWEVTRLCEENNLTTTTTTSTSSTTTTTTTIAPTTTTTTTLTGLVSSSISSVSNISDACSEVLDSICWIDTGGDAIAVGDRVYNDSFGNNPLVGDGNYYRISDSFAGYDISASINALGYIQGPISICS